MKFIILVLLIFLIVIPVEAKEVAVFVATDTDLSVVGERIFDVAHKFIAKSSFNKHSIQGTARYIHLNKDIIEGDGLHKLTRKLSKSYRAGKRYGTYIYILPDRFFSKGVAGYATVGATLRTRRKKKLGVILIPESSINSKIVLEHEIGHTLGAGHDGAKRTPYNNPFSIMGNINRVDYACPWKEKFGWLDKEDVAVVADLSPEIIASMISCTSNQSGIKMVKIPRKLRSWGFDTYEISGNYLVHYHVYNEGNTVRLEDYERIKA